MFEFTAPSFEFMLDEDCVFAPIKWIVASLEVGFFIDGASGFYRLFFCLRVEFCFGG